MGQMVTGPQAEHLAQSIEAANPPSRAITFTEYIRTLFRLMTSAGIEPERWLLWSRARARAFMNARSDEAADIDESVDRMLKQAKQNNAAPLIRVTLPMRTF